MTTTRLSRTDWLTAGFEALRGDGPQALAAEPMARRIGTTKGSFYWHFRDVSAFHAALLQHWRDGALTALADHLAGGGHGAARLRAFGHLILADPLEPRLRNWAQDDAAVAQALAEIDSERLTYLSALLGQMGLRNRDFSRALLATLIGLPQLTEAAANRAAAFDTLVDTILALS